MYSVQLDWQGGRAFLATGSLGTPVPLDLSPAAGGTGRGMRPFELLLAGLAYCSAIDVLEILEKQRQPVRHISIRVEATTRKEGERSSLDEATLVFSLEGPQEEKADKAIRLSLDTYCSVSGMFGRFCRIGYRLECAP